MNHRNLLTGLTIWALPYLLFAVALGLNGCDGWVPNPNPTPTPAPTAHPTLAPIWPGPTAFGVQTHMNSRLDTGELDLIQAAGGALLDRDTLDAYWVGKPGGTTWDLKPYQAIYNAQVQRHIGPLFIIANPPCVGTQQYITDTIAFLKAQIPTWTYAQFELGNEPDLITCGGVDLTASIYWGWYAPIAATIRKVDPSAKIVTGGTARINSTSGGGDTPWNTALGYAGAFKSGLVDVVGVHTYGDYLIEPPGVTGGDVHVDLVALKAALPPGMPVYITEMGLVPPAYCAELVGDFTTAGWFPEMKRVGVAGFFYYEFRDEATAPMGLVDINLNPKPTYDCVKGWLQS